MLFGCTDTPEVSNTPAQPQPIEKPAQPTVVSRIAFGSCNKHDLPQPLWQPIISSKPDLWIWLGDIIYGDTSDMKVMQRKYQAEKANPGYQALLKTTPVIGTWDDHDYGKNNAGKEYKKKAESQQELLDFLDEPADSERRQQAGVYTAYTYGTVGKQVKVILLDTRYHRDTPGKNSDILGEQQWNWLEKELKNSQAQINLIVSSIQVLPEEHKNEKWENFPKSRQRLFDLIAETKSPGVIFISGDRHFAEISKMKTGSIPYPLYEITSSGLTHSWEKLEKEPNKYRQGQFFKYLHFGLMEIDWNSKPVLLKLQIRDENNQVKLEQKVNLSELSFTSKK
ncbi:alkaline phosphatase D family protein [Microcoleus sp. FACHB-68]|uniref:alkaline phosphatase D family protein n=1 Tax=Microcoleus sp. FACHB-68 TaxID=2692826 RepID=UPI001F559B12|nr:alkaline phosphatase D family protein [Microcoleus sp. FACHB-68]